MIRPRPARFMPATRLDEKCRTLDEEQQLVKQIRPRQVLDADDRLWPRRIDHEDIHGSHPGFDIGHRGSDSRLVGDVSAEQPDVGTVSADVGHNLRGAGRGRQIVHRNCHPSRARPTAISAPRPRPAPVTSATRAAVSVMDIDSRSRDTRTPGCRRCVVKCPRRDRGVGVVPPGVWVLSIHVGGVQCGVAVDHAGRSILLCVVVVVVPAQQAAVVDAGGSAEGEVDDVMRLGPQRGRRCSRGTSSLVPGDHGQPLSLGEDPVRGSVRGDTFRFVEDHREHPGITAGHRHACPTGSSAPWPVWREPRPSCGLVGGEGEQDRGGDPVTGR